MGEEKKMQKRKQAPPVVFTPASEVVKVDVYDQNAVKQLLDDVIMTYVLETRGLEEDLTYSNYKLALGGLSCLVAIASHAFPTPFPENAWVLKVCVVSYIVLSVLLQYVAFYMEGNTILAPAPPNGAAPATSSSSPSTSRPTSPSARRRSSFRSPPRRASRLRTRSPPPSAGGSSPTEPSSARPSSLTWTSSSPPSKMPATEDEDDDEQRKYTP